jgi:hypothetical protein
MVVRWEKTSAKEKWEKGKRIDSAMYD